MTNTLLNGFCQRIARLEEQRRDLANDIASIKEQAKDAGFDTALITRTVRLLISTPKKRAEALQQHELFDNYLAATGLLPELEEAAPTQDTADIDGEEHQISAADGVNATVWLPPKYAAAIGDKAEAAGFEVKVAGHDPDTEEIINETSTAELAVPAAGEEGGGSPPVTPPSSQSDPGPMPAFLDRHRKVEEAAQC